MSVSDRNLLYKTSFTMRFFDEDWNEVEELSVTSSDELVIGMHLRKWRQSQLDRLLENRPQDQSKKYAVCACVEVTCG